MKTRLFKAMAMDVRVQWRNKLYAIGLTVAAMIGAGISYGAGTSPLAKIIPALLLTLIGSSTLLYVAGLILFEKDEGTLNAIMVSPMKHNEYLWSKIITLTALATLESLTIVGISAVALPQSMPNWPLLLLGLVILGMFYTLIGIILIVRFEKITDFLIPMSIIAMILQIPFVHFVGMVEHVGFLAVPSSAPTMILLAAYQPIEANQWLYAIAYSAITLIGLSIWAHRAFVQHIVMNME